MKSAGFANPGADVSAKRDTQRGTKKPGRNRSRKAARKVTAAEAKFLVWDLRRQGYDYRTIAALTAEAGHAVSRSQAHRICQDEIAALAAETKETVDLHRVAVRDRLESFIAALAPKIAIGDSRAVQAANKAQDQINKLFGLYAPVKVDLKDERFRALPEETLDTELRRYAHANGYSLVPAG